MSAVKPLNQTTDKEYPCTHCGSKSYTIVRQDDKNPRLKCASCNFIYSGEDSERALNSGEIPESSPETLAEAADAHREVAKDRPETERLQEAEPFHSPPATDINIPRTPKFVFLSKDRKRSEFSTQKDVKAVALRWEAQGINYEVYELTPKKFEVNVNIE